MKLTKMILQIWLGLLILVQTSLFQIALPELVICFGEDGHVAIERDDCQDCVHPQNDEEDAAITRPDNHQNEFGCTDLSLDLHTGTPLTKAGQNHYDPPAASCIFSALNIGGLQKNDLNRFTSPRSFQHPILYSIQVTTLLI